MVVEQVGPVEGSQPSMPTAQNSPNEYCGRVTVEEKTVKNFLDGEAVGLDVSYKCPKCRECSDCRKGDIFEQISIKDEAAQHVIVDSVKIDKEKKRFVAKLPWRVNPELVLKDNEKPAGARLDKICDKYDDDVKETIVKAIKKMHDNCHVLFESEFSPELREMLDSKVGHYICYDAVFSDSISTPTRPVFDASRNTPGGTNLNDCLYRGIPILTNLLGVLLDWTLEVYVVVGDISMFYNAFLLDLVDLPYQKFLYKEGLRKENERIVGVILTLIYGVRSVAAQTEAGIAKFCEMIQDIFPHVANLLRKKRYVDDLVKSLATSEARTKLVQDLDECLQSLSMKVKGYSYSGEHPHEKCTKDGVSITVIGYRWFVQMDCFGLNLQPLHFENKIRGRLPDEVEYFGKGGKLMKMEDFVPEKITRRAVTKVLGRVYDPLGKFAVFMSKPKLLLRTTIEVSPVWDDPLPPEIRALWVEVLGEIEDLRNLYFQRARIPADAQRPLQIRFLAGADAGGDCMVAGVWVGVRLATGGWSCAHMLGKSLLPGKGWTIPMKELHSLWVGATLLDMVGRLLQDWCEGRLNKRYLFGDSRIAMAWTIYDNTKLLPFHRHRVIEITKKVNMDELYHCPGDINPTDGGTKIKGISVGLVGPDSVWERGLPWMRAEEEEIEQTLMSVDKIKLDDGQAKVMKEALIAPKFESEIKGFSAFTVNVDLEKVQKRMEAGPYMEVLSPTKFPHRFTLRVYAYSIKFILAMRRKVNERRLEKGEEARKALLLETYGRENMMDIFVVFGAWVRTPEDLPKVYSCVNVVVGLEINYGSRSNKKRWPSNPQKWIPVEQNRYFPWKAKQQEINLSPEDLSNALVCVFRWTSGEVVAFNDAKWVREQCEWSNGILIRRGRITEGIEVQITEDAESFMKPATLVNVNYCVPVLDRHSPWSISIATHIHCNVRTAKHRSAVTCHRASLALVYIIRGLGVFKKVVDNCTFCARIKKKFYRRVMGSPHPLQLTVSPLFFATMVDLVGPYATYVPGFERVTRSSKQKQYNVYIAMFICLGTGCINLQLVECQSTTGLMEAVCRFAMESGTPAHMFPDKQSGLEAMLKKVQVTLRDLQGQLYKEHGIRFSTCPAQAHWQHGRVERLARIVRESITREQFTMLRLHVLGWQTIIKIIENTINDTPIGSISRRDNESAEQLEIMCPNTFKFARLNRRSPQAPFQVPNVDMRDYTAKVQKVWQAWWRTWQDFYIEELFVRPKWFEEGEEVSIGDLVMFKRVSGEFGNHFSIGKVDEFSQSHDGEGRNVWVKYKLPNEVNSRRVERDIKTIYKVLSIEDTPLHDMLEQAWRLSQQYSSAGGEGQVGPVEGSQPSMPTAQDSPNGLVPQDGGEHDHGQSGEAGSKLRNKVKAKRRSELELLKEWSVKTAADVRTERNAFVDTLFCDRGLDEELEMCKV